MNGGIESEMTAKSASTLLMVDNETGVKAMVDAMERETGRAAVPWWPGRRWCSCSRCCRHGWRNPLLRRS